MSALAVLQWSCGQASLGTRGELDQELEQGRDDLDPASPGAGDARDRTVGHGDLSSPRQELPPEASPAEEPTGSPPTPGFVSARDGAFVLDGEPFSFGGANRYDLTFDPPERVDEALDAAVAMNLKVLRAWFFYDSGSFDGQGPAHVHYQGSHQGVFFHFWDNQKQAPTFNEGENGLKHLDYVLAAARERGLKILAVLTNNWSDMGGMDQYLTWYDLPKHEDFYTDEQVQQDYQDWVSHLVQRRNTVDWASSIGTTPPSSPGSWPTSPAAAAAA